MPNFECDYCKKTFSRKWNRDRHTEANHINNVKQVFVCAFCGEVFPNFNGLKTHRLGHAPSNGFVLFNSALNRSAIIYRKTYGDVTVQTIEEAYSRDKKELRQLLLFELTNKKIIKASVIYKLEFTKEDENGDDNTYEICIRRPMEILFNTHQIGKFLFLAKSHADGRVDDFIENGSGWRLNEVLCTDLEINVCKSLSGSCSLLSIKSRMRPLKTIEGFDNDERNNCFFEAIAYHFVKKRDERMIQAFIDKNMTINIKSPVRICDITKFEKQNQHLHIKINVVYEDDEEIYPIYTSAYTTNTNSVDINLFLYKTVVNKHVENHYAYIEDIGKFIRKKYEYQTQLTTKYSYQNCHPCMNCFQNFSSQYFLQRHQMNCLQHKPQAVQVPEKGAVLQFQDNNRQFKLPIIGFFDFEAMQEKENCDTIKCGSKTKILGEQKPIAYALVLIDRFNKIIHQAKYAGIDCVSHLISHLLTIEPTLLKLIKKYTPMVMTQDDIDTYQEATVCHICNGILRRNSYGKIDKVRDHDHLTGQFIGAAHNSCNLNRKSILKIPMFAHNFAGYDSHFIATGLACKDDRIKKIEAMPINTEKFRGITMNSFQFSDTLLFLPSSLSQLVSDLVNGGICSFKLLDKMYLYDKNDVHGKELLLRKGEKIVCACFYYIKNCIFFFLIGVYPYEYITSFDILQERELPPRKMFHSILTNEDISQEDYKHAVDVFNHFKCKTLLDYTLLYCTSDVILLAEVFLHFRQEIHSFFKLDCW